ncbi:MAG TPA: hypothetical protein VFN67_27600 [Polyangiales bacterium]|nr:hypothetical protein [Polyangiales bacterium]
MVRFTLVLCALLSVASRAQATVCSARRACQGSASRDAVELRDGSVLCGTIVFKSDGHSLLVIDDEHRSRSVTWDDIACLDQQGAAPAPASTASEMSSPVAGAKESAGHVDEAVVPPPAAADEFLADDEPGERRLWLEWDVRVAGSTVWKRYVERASSAWSWGMSGGLGFGATVHYGLGMTGGLGPLYWADLELGIGGTVTYGTWNQINAGNASMIEQDLSLRVGTRFRLGGPTSGVVAGISWLPTYVDFYGRQIKTPGTINPLGVRLALDLGGGPGYRHSTVFRMSFAFLPYVGRLPSMFVVSAGIALD